MILVRQRLPNRRPSEAHTLSVGNQTFTATVGFDPENGQPRELFLDAPKRDSMFGAMLADVATIISIALQSGVPAAALAKSVGRAPNVSTMPGSLDQLTAGSQAASPIGGALDLLAACEKEAAK